MTKNWVITALVLTATFGVAWLTETKAAEKTVSTADELVAAVNAGAEGDHVILAAGTYKLARSLEPKAGMTLKGAGIGKTIITHIPKWKPSVSSLPDPEMRWKGMDTRAFLIRVEDDASKVTISDMTLLGPQMHGAIFGINNQSLNIQRVRIQDTLWTGIRTFGTKGGKIIDCQFIDAGGRWERGKPGVKGGITGGAIFGIWMKDTEIAHNRFTRTKTAKQNEFYGVKIRQGQRCRIHHNTIEVNFSIELPFENDEDNEIDHNICYGTISIPKHAGGVTPASGKTFRIHHNYFTNGYSIEFVRNGVEIDHNLFDFDAKKDGGNLISGFGRAPAKGPALFHNNLVSNPGRGVIWINEPYNQFVIRNNHIIARPTPTPRLEGLFGFNRKCDFKTFKLVGNIIECTETARPLFRNDESYGATVANNKLMNLSDGARYKNPAGDGKVGLEAPLKFACGVHGELTVDGWKTHKTPSAEK